MSCMPKKLQKRENVKIFVGEQVHIGNNNTKINSDFEIGCKKCRKCKRITQEKYFFCMVGDLARNVETNLFITNCISEFIKHLLLVNQIKCR
jgi:hypothetical protein